MHIFKNFFKKIHRFNIILFILGATRQQRVRTAKKQKVAGGDEREIANMAEIAAKGIICCYIGTELIIFYCI